MDVIRQDRLCENVGLRPTGRIENSTCHDLGITTPDALRTPVSMPRDMGKQAVLAMTSSSHA
jgi:hypothetical protein